MSISRFKLANPVVLFALLLVSPLVSRYALATPNAKVSVPKVVTNPAQAITLPLTDKKLQSYEWQLISVTDKASHPIRTALFAKNTKPLILKFERGGKLRLVNTCNNLWTNYMLTTDNVVIGDFASTQIGCSSVQEKFDNLAPTTLKGQFKLTETSDGQPVLTVTGDKHISIFKPMKK